MKYIYLPLLFVGLSLIPDSLLAQQKISWERNLDNDSIDFVQDMVVSAEGESYIALIRNGKGTIEVTGEAILRKLDNEGGSDWTIPFAGTGTLTDILFDEDKLYFAGHASTKITVLSNTIPPNSLYVGCLGAQGNLIWLNHTDTVSGIRARMVINSSNELFVSAQKFFGKSSIIRLNASGQFMKGKAIPGLSISDMVIDDENNIYLTGMVPQQSTIDTVTIAPNPVVYNYPSYTLKINSNMVAEWVRFTRYVTFDWHHRMAFFNNQIVVFQRVSDTASKSAASLLNYAKSGQLLSHKYLKTYMSSPFVELSANADNLFALFDSWRFSSPGMADTLRVSIFDKNMNNTGSVAFASGFTIQFFSYAPFQIGSDKCGFVFGSAYTGDSIIANGARIDAMYSGNTVCVAAVDICNASASVPRFISNNGMIYPNPGSGIFTIETEGEPIEELFIYDIHGRLIRSAATANSTTARIDITDQPAGMYSIFLRSSGEMRSVKVVKQ